MPIKIPAPLPNSLTAPNAASIPVVGVYLGDAGDSISVTPGPAGVGLPYVNIGQPDTAVRAGVRIAASRVILKNAPTLSIAVGAGITATVTQLLEGGIFTSAVAAALTLPSMQGPAGLVQALPGVPAVGDIIEIQLVMNHATNLFTLTAGAGSTIFGIATNTNGSRLWRGQITSVAAGAEAVTWY
jgi:hypothetical protein